MHIFKVVYDWWQINLSDHVLLNLNSPAPKPAVNIIYETWWWTSLMWGKKPSPKIIINKGSATDTIYLILFNSTIHNHFLNPYCTQFKTVKICQIRNLSSCELCSMKQLKLLQTVKQKVISWSNYIVVE